MTRFSAGQRTNQKRDTRGDGQFDSLLEFENDLQVRQRRDTTGDRNFDLQVTFDAQEKPAREEFDLSSDGKSAQVQL